MGEEVSKSVNGFYSRNEEQLRRNQASQDQVVKQLKRLAEGQVDYKERLRELCTSATASDEQVQSVEAEKAWYEEKLLEMALLTAEYLEMQLRLGKIEASIKKSQREMMAFEKSASSLNEEDQTELERLFKEANK